MELNAKEREIIAYLLHRRERMFTADLDGGHATTLISRGIVRGLYGRGKQTLGCSNGDSPTRLERD